MHGYSNYCHGYWADVFTYYYSVYNYKLYMIMILELVIIYHYDVLFWQFIRRSTEGLSLPMFVLAVLGNVTYGLGVFLVSVDPVFILRKLPWIIGSVGTLVFDVTVSSQFCSQHCVLVLYINCFQEFSIIHH